MSSIRLFLNSLQGEHEKLSYSKKGDLTCIYSQSKQIIKKNDCFQPLFLRLVQRKMF